MESALQAYSMAFIINGSWKFLFGYVHVCDQKCVNGRILLHRNIFSKFTYILDLIKYKRSKNLEMSKVSRTIFIKFYHYFLTAALLIMCLVNLLRYCHSLFSSLWKANVVESNEFISTPPPFYSFYHKHIFSPSIYICSSYCVQNCDFFSFISWVKNWIEKGYTGHFSILLVDFISGL